ncbi:MAG: polysaccharide deacetylase family protein [Burkholderiaceae bacterium]|nr:polysaccharide deacetylase family protein [Burkholderiaceae bacterium]
MLFKALTHIATRSGPEARLSVLLYHRVLDRPDPLRPTTPDAEMFGRHMRWLCDQFSVMSLTEAVDRLREGSLPPRAAAVTFDDGYRDNATNAAPILRDAGLSATVFVNTAYLDGRVPFFELITDLVRGFDGERLDLEDWGLGCHEMGTDDQRSSAIDAICGQLKYLAGDRCDRYVAEIAQREGVPITGDLMLDEAALGTLVDAGLEIGSHGHDHFILSTLSPHEARDQLARSRDIIASMTGAAPRFYAYPNGKRGIDFDDTHIEMVKDAGYDAAFAADDGVCCSTEQLFSLPRFGPWATNGLRFKTQMLCNALGVYEKETSTA